MLFPLLPWLLAGSVEDRFSGTATLKSVANLAALFGLAAWAVALVLASRIRPVERVVGGVENLYPLHRRTGVLVAILATTHVVFLTLHEGSSALDLYLPDTGLSVFTGVIAFVLLIGFVVTSITRDLPYPTFVLVQRLLGVTFLIGAFHSFAVRGTMASSFALTVYLGCLTAAGIACIGYRLIGGRLGVGRHDYRVADVRHLGDAAVEITLTPVGRPLEFRAGQFVYATFHQSGIPLESHPFTISSPPGGDSIRLAVKRLGDFTGSVMTLRPGARAQLEGPFGRFCISPDGVHAQTWIAGGIGITPFLSWARSLDEPVAAGAGETVGDVLSDPRAEEPSEWAERRNTVRRVRELLPTLASRERRVLSGRFPADDRPRTLCDLGDELGVSAERVRQIEQSALSKLRAALC